MGLVIARLAPVKLYHFSRDYSRGTRPEPPPVPPMARNRGKSPVFRRFLCLNRCRGTLRHGARFRVAGRRVGSPGRVAGRRVGSPVAGSPGHGPRATGHGPGKFRHAPRGTLPALIHGDERAGQRKAPAEHPAGARSRYAGTLRREQFHGGTLRLRLDLTARPFA